MARLQAMLVDAIRGSRWRRSMRGGLGMCRDLGFLVLFHSHGKQWQLSGRDRRGISALLDPHRGYYPVREG